MTKTQALENVASLLAVNTADHVRVLKDIPNLHENTMEAARKNRYTAIALGIDDLYTQKLFIHMQGLWDLLRIKQL